MKTCPTCFSTAFDDMAVCYGCLQPFDQVVPEPSNPVTHRSDPEYDREFELSYDSEDYWEDDLAVSIIQRR